MSEQRPNCYAPDKPEPTEAELAARRTEMERMLAELKDGATEEPKP